MENIVPFCGCALLPFVGTAPLAYRGRGQRIRALTKHSQDRLFAAASCQNGRAPFYGGRHIEPTAFFDLTDRVFVSLVVIGYEFCLFGLGGGRKRVTIDLVIRWLDF